MMQTIISAAFFVVGFIALLRAIYIWFTTGD
jgi:hypothetical protein